MSELKGAQANKFARRMLNAENSPLRCIATKKTGDRCTNKVAMGGLCLMHYKLRLFGRRKVKVIRW